MNIFITMRKLILVLLTSILLSIAHAQTTIKDVLDREVTVPENPQRILLGFYFEDFYAIVGPNAYQRVVAISKETWQGWRNLQWQAYAAVDPRLEELVDVGDVDSGTFNIEAAIAARPDLAILAAWQYNALGEVAGKLEAAGIPVVVVDYNAQTTEKHVLSTHIIGKIMDSEQRARHLAAQYVAAVADVHARIAAFKGEKKPIYVELGNKGPDEYGNSYANTMWGKVIEEAGGLNLADGKIENWGPLNPEYVIASNPAMIIIPGSDWANRDKAVLMGFGIAPETTRERLRPFTDRPGWSNLAAVKNGEVYSLYHGGVRTLYDYAFLQYVAKALYPEAFADINPVANHKRFYDTYLPIPADGAFMVKLDP